MFWTNASNFFEIPSDCRLTLWMNVCSWSQFKLKKYWHKKRSITSHQREGGEKFAASVEYSRIATGGGVYNWPTNHTCLNPKLSFLEKKWHQSTFKWSFYYYDLVYRMWKTVALDLFQFELTLKKYHYHSWTQNRNVQTCYWCIVTFIINSINLDLEQHTVVLRCSEKCILIGYWHLSNVL